MTCSIVWDVPAQEPQFSDLSQVARLAKYLYMFDQQTLNLSFGLSGGLISCSKDLHHEFHTLLHFPTTFDIWPTRTSSPQTWHDAPAASRSSADACHLLGKIQNFLFFCTKNIKCTQKNILSKPNLSSTDATFKTVSHFKGSSAWAVAHLWGCSAVPVLTPMAGDASHPKKTIQGQAEIPTSAVHQATTVLRSTPLSEIES